MSLTFSGKDIVTRTSPLSSRFEKSIALSPFIRKSSASTGRKSGSSAFLFCSNFSRSASNRALAAAGESWKPSDGMWQSAHERPLPPSWFRLRSLKALRPRATTSHGCSSQLSCIAPFPSKACPWPECGTTAAITPNKTKPKKAMVELFSLRIVFIPSWIFRWTLSPALT
jgi:hypothetical protein